MGPFSLSPSPAEGAPHLSRAASSFPIAQAQAGSSEAAQGFSSCSCCELMGFC